ncbi:MAG: SCO family protein [Propionivibrio sp.]|nr:SCO family protein [Propionivibrio sp.]
MKQHYWIAIGAFLTGLLVWLAFFWQPDAPNPALPDQFHNLRQPSGPLPAGDFAVTTPDDTFSLADYRGKIVLVYFGYTFCPDVCPTSLAALGQAFAALSAEELARVKGVFVSVDPERDTLEILKVYAPFFHPNIIGATGTPEQLADIARRYGVSYMKQKSIDGRPYTVDHSSFTYLIGPDGKLAVTLPHGSSPEELIAAIRLQLTGKKNN